MGAVSHGAGFDATVCDALKESEANPKNHESTADRDYPKRSAGFCDTQDVHARLSRGIAEVPRVGTRALVDVPSEDEEDGKES